MATFTQTDAPTKTLQNDKKMATFTQTDAPTKTLEIDENFPGYSQIKEQVEATFKGNEYVYGLPNKIDRPIAHLKGHTSCITQIAPPCRLVGRGYSSNWGWTLTRRNAVKSSYYIANDGDDAEQKGSFANVKAIGINDDDYPHSIYRTYGKFALQSDEKKPGGNIKLKYMTYVKNEKNIGGHTFTETFGLHGAVVTTVLRDFCTEKGWTYRPIVILNEKSDGIPGPALQDELEYWARKDPEFQGFRN